MPRYSVPSELELELEFDPEPEAPEAGRPPLCAAFIIALPIDGGRVTVGLRRDCTWMVSPPSPLPLCTTVRERSTMGNARATEGGKLHLSVTHTRRDCRPSACTISVAAGVRLAMVHVREGTGCGTQEGECRWPSPIVPIPSSPPLPPPLSTDPMPPAGGNDRSASMSSRSGLDDARRMTAVGSDARRPAACEIPRLYSDMPTDWLFSIMGVSAEELSSLCVRRKYACCFV
mmetsp:Transcript_38316/g.95204  ORF Transcript_38316/g.95204 Transcript_38316/m.95204 type:complete len:231 (+) Transcript_38316:511-1203(+)